MGNFFNLKKIFIDFVDAMFSIIFLLIILTEVLKASMWGGYGWSGRTAGQRSQKKAD